MHDWFSTRPGVTFLRHTVFNAVEVVNNYPFSQIIIDSYHQYNDRDH